MLFRRQLQDEVRDEQVQSVIQMVRTYICKEMRHDGRCSQSSVEHRFTRVYILRASSKSSYLWTYLKLKKNQLFHSHKRVDIEFSSPHFWIFNIFSIQTKSANKLFLRCFLVWKGCIQRKFSQGIILDYLKTKN